MDNEVLNSALELGFQVEPSDGELELTRQSEGTEAAAEEVSEEVEASAESEQSESQDGEEVEGEEAPQTEIQEVSEEETANENQEVEILRSTFEAKEKIFNAEKEQYQQQLQEHQEKVQTHDQIDGFLADLAERDPDLFNVFKDEFTKFNKQFSNPVLDDLRSKQAALEKELMQFKSKASDEVTLTKLDSEMKDFKASIGKEAETAGIKVDYQSIEDMWAKGLTVKEAFFAKYGDSYAKARESKAKLAIAEKKAANLTKTPTAGSVKKTNAADSVDFSKMSIDEAVHYFAAKQRK